MKLAFLEKELNKKFLHIQEKGISNYIRKANGLQKSTDFWKMQNKNLMNFNKNTIERVCHKR